ncbi:hypothetical protein [Aeromonas caviae]|uniref:hypothetical protein n=1 Tax=Aeromonas caviae TaxID=648 RepID=UPI002B4A5B06|nr:hypothetical protein [Aeromonas caviae]
MRTISDKISIPILGLVLAGIGIISPIAWDWWNKHSQLTVETKSIATIASNVQPIKGLELFLNGKKIGVINRVLIEFRNSGRTPVTKDDIVSPININFGDGEILDAKIEKKSPKNIDATLSTGNNLVVSFSLLNPDEYFEVSVLTTSNSPTVSASARIKNISQIEITSSVNSISIRSEMLVPVIAIGFLGFLLGTAGIMIAREVPKKLHAARALEAGTHFLLSADTHKEARKYLYSDLDFLSDSRRMRVDAAIDTESWPLDSANKDSFCAVVLESVKDENTVGPALLSLSLAGLAFWYVFTRFA